MKVAAAALASIVLAPALAHASPVPGVRVTETPVAVAFFDPWLGLPGGIGQSVTGFDLGIVLATPLDLTGLGVSFGVDMVLDSVAGVQIAGLANLANASRGTLQIATLANYATRGPVIQLAAGLDYAGDISGAQLAPVNIVEDLDGAQLGVVNRARHVRGLQLGVVNYARRLEGVQLGVVNIDRSSRLPFTLILNVGW